MSLASRIIAFFLVALAVVLLGFSATLYLLARSHLEGDLDERLVVALDTLSAAAEVEPDRIEWRPGLRPPIEGEQPGEEPLSWVVLDGRGFTVDRSQGPLRLELSGALDDLPTTGHFHESFVDPNGRVWRLAVHRVRPARLVGRHRGDVDRVPEPAGPTRNPGLETTTHSSLILATGAPLAPLQARLRTVGLTLAGLSLVLWLLAAVAGRALGRGALRPMRLMAQAAGSMTADDGGQRLPSPGTGDELEDLGRSFNGLLGRLHEALVRQQRFTGDASHQLRTPLAALRGQIEVALRRERPAEEYRRVLEQAHAETVRLHQIVEALLFLARSASDAARPDLELVDLSEWVPEHLLGWSAHPRASDLHVVDETGGLARALVHRPLLGLLIDNLVENAFKYSEPAAPVVVRTTREPGALVLAVEDEGDGLAPEESSKVFEPFYRSPRARRQGKPGVGLGLAVVQRVVEAFGGSVVAEGSPGRGTRFVVRLPEAVGSPLPLEAEESARPIPASG